MCCYQHSTAYIQGMATDQGEHNVLVHRVCHCGDSATKNSHNSSLRTQHTLVWQQIHQSQNVAGEIRSFGHQYRSNNHHSFSNSQTDTDFGTATFIIDDTEVQNRNASVFMVTSNLQPIKVEAISSLKRNQEKIDVTLPGTCLITVTNSHVKHYIRFGLNQNNGSSQTDIFVVDKNGNVDMNAPIIWDFDQKSIY